jgi:hypothetical protein
MPLPLFALVLWCGGLLFVLANTAPDAFSLPMLALFVGSGDGGYAPHCSKSHDSAVLQRPR